MRFATGKLSPKPIPKLLCLAIDRAERLELTDDLSEPLDVVPDRHLRHSAAMVHPVGSASVLEQWLFEEFKTGAAGRFEQHGVFAVEQLG
jgi:hypothetical protein